MNRPPRVLSLSPRLVQWSALCGLLLLGAFLRLYQLEYKSLWVDEILQVNVARGGIAGVLANAHRHVLGAPPLDYLVTAVIRLVGENEFILRFPPVAWGVLTIALSFVLARRQSGSRPVAISSAVLITAAPLIVRFSQEARFYSLPIALLVLLVYAFLRAWQKPTTLRWILFSLVTFVAYFAHYYVIFAVAALGLAALIGSLPFFRDRPRDLRQAWIGFIAAAAVPSLLLLAWFKFEGFTGQAIHQFIPPPLADLLLSPVVDPISAMPEQRIFLIVVGGFIFPLLALWSLATSIRARRMWGITLALVVLLGVAGVLIADWRASYFYTSRQVLFFVPFYLILVADGLVGVVRSFLRRESWAVAGTALALGSLLFVFSFSLRGGYDLPKQDWRGAAEFFSQNFAHAANLTLSSPNGLKQFLIFYEPSLEQHFVAEADLPALDPNTRVWFVTLGENMPGTPKELTAADGWHAVNLGMSGALTLAYMGKAPPRQLLRELAQLELSPRVLLYSDFLLQLDATDAALAHQVAVNAVAAMKTARPPLLDGQQKRLLRKIGALK